MTNSSLGFYMAYLLLLPHVLLLLTVASTAIHYYCCYYCCYCCYCYCCYCCCCSCCYYCCYCCYCYSCYYCCYCCYCYCCSCCCCYCCYYCCYCCYCYCCYYSYCYCSLLYNEYLVLIYGIQNPVCNWMGWLIAWCMMMHEYDALFRLLIETTNKKQDKLRAFAYFCFIQFLSNE